MSISIVIRQHLVVAHTSRSMASSSLIFFGFACGTHLQIPPQWSGDHGGHCRIFQDSKTSSWWTLRDAWNPPCLPHGAIFQSQKKQSSPRASPSHHPCFSAARVLFSVYFSFFLLRHKLDPRSEKFVLFHHSAEYNLQTSVAYLCGFEHIEETMFLCFWVSNGLPTGVWVWSPSSFSKMKTQYMLHQVLLQVFWSHTRVFDHLPPHESGGSHWGDSVDTVPLTLNCKLCFQLRLLEHPVPLVSFWILFPTFVWQWSHLLALWTILKDRF